MPLSDFIKKISLYREWIFILLVNVAIIVNCLVLWMITECSEFYDKYVCSNPPPDLMKNFMCRLYQLVIPFVLIAFDILYVIL